jgi:hypothetical protein
MGVGVSYFCMRLLLPGGEIFPGETRLHSVSEGILEMAFRMPIIKPMQPLPDIGGEESGRALSIGIYFRGRLRFNTLCLFCVVS